MAEQQQQPQPLKAPFPPPPPFFKSFTTANLGQLRKLRKESQREADYRESNPDLNILSLPPELRYLVPPNPPTDGTWASYGDVLNVHPTQPSLADSGIEQLYPSTASATANPQPHLIALARSLLTTFLSLIGILSQNPTLYASKVDDLQTICFNMHDLINQYRPHQARESLILMMEERVRSIRDEIRRVREGREKIGDLLRDWAHGDDRDVKIETADSGDGQGTGVGEVWKARQRAAWSAIEVKVGQAGSGE